nr:hypothetical protein REQ54_02739 [Rhizobium sp. Q54]
MTDTSKPLDASLEQSLPEVLMRLVSELHDVAYLIERVEPQLLELGGANIMEHPDSIKVLQGIDLAVQKTRGLAEFVDTITGTIPEDWMVDVSTALSLVKLADMHKALATGVRHGHSQPLSKAAGDFDFF